MAVFSQPSNDTDDGSTAGADTSTPPPSWNVYPSLAATLALQLGDIDGVRAQVPEADRAAFDQALAVQSVRDDTETVSRFERMVSGEVEKRRANYRAYEQFVAEEEAALRAADDADADAFGQTLTSMELDDIPEPEFLVEGFFARRSVAQLYGPPKSYKSFIMLDVAGCIGSGIPWQGKATESAKVLYVAAEGAGGIKRRVRAWEELYKRPMVGVEFYPKAIQLGNRKETRALIAYTKRHEFGMVIFDTQARCTVGIEENSNTDMGRVIAALDSLKEVTGTCVVLVHHSGADGQRARGATAVLGAVDSQFMVKPEKDTMSVSLITTAQKDTGEHPAIEMDLVTPGPGHALAVKKRAPWYRQAPEEMEPLPSLEHTLLNVVVAFDQAGATEQMINSRVSDDTDKAAVREALGQLLKKGCIARQGSNWKATPFGQRRIGGQLPE